MKYLIYLFCLAVVSTSLAEDIHSVLQRSASLRLQQLIRIDPTNEDSIKLRASFDKILAQAHISPTSVDFQVVEGPQNAEAILGKHIVAGRGLAQATEDERIFILAHELGHITNGHWDRFCAIYKKHIPGEVTKEVTDAVMGRLGPEASSISHANEYEADAYAFNLIRKLNINIEAAIRALLLNSILRGNATHPATKDRIMHLRSFEAKE